MAEHNDRSAATEDALEETKGCIARAIYEVAIRWIKGNFPEGHEFLDFSQVDERTCNLHFDYADAVLAVMPAPAQRPSVMDAVILTEKLIQAAVDYENGVCGRQELSKARAAVETALAAQPPAAPAETNTNANPASRSTATATAIAGDDRESMETRPLKVVSPEAGSPPQCSAGNDGDLREKIAGAIRSMATVTESTNAIMEIIAAQPQRSAATGALAKAIQDLEMFIDDVEGSEAAEGGTIDGTEAAAALDILRSVVPQIFGVWQTVETAPKDGTPVDLFTISGRRWCDYRFDKEQLYPSWTLASTKDFDWQDRPIIPASSVTHWMPLPSSPLTRPESK